MTRKISTEEYQQEVADFVRDFELHGPDKLTILTAALVLYIKAGERKDKTIEEVLEAYGDASIIKSLMVGSYV